MGLVIGEGFGPSTWGALRSVIFNGNLSGSPIANSGDHNVEYDHGFKTTAGNGFVRTDYGALYFGDVTTGPNFYATGLTATPPKSEFGSGYYGSSSGCLVNEDRAQLTGETAVLGTGSLTITADAFVGPYYQNYSLYSATETLTSIGKLTAF
jgi:hypothetical protein